MTNETQGEKAEGLEEVKAEEPESGFRRPMKMDDPKLPSALEVAEHENVATAICQAAERFGADAICCATHGLSGLSKALMGSVAQKVLAESPRPLLLVHPRMET